MAGMMEAVLLAGGVNKGKLAERSSERWEALIDIKGRPMAAYVVKAMLDSGIISRVVVSGPDELKAALSEFGDKVTLVKPGEHLLDSLLNALSEVRESMAVIGTADIPLLTGDAIKEMAEACGRDKAEVYYALVYKEDYDRQYPGGERTYVKLKDGVLTGANLFLASKDAIMARKDIISDMYAKRKNPLAMAISLGLGPIMLLKLVTGRVSVKEIEAIARKSFKLEGRGVRIRNASVAMDVDKPSDLDLAIKNVKW